MKTDQKKGGTRKGDYPAVRDGRLMSPFLDWTFKHIFATEESKSYIEKRYPIIRFQNWRTLLRQVQYNIIAIALH